jgi:hypothetical protein
MLIVFNIILILIVLLLAYWWANQGFFSAVLHLFCVIIAGAIALAFWEPLTVGLLLRGNWFDNYAWGVSLIGLFGVSLFVLRVTLDKLAPGNVDLPHGFNLGLGGVAGAAAGVLTLGIVLIGASFVQSSNALMGWQGHQRSSSGQVARSKDLWIPYHQIASEFYDWVSVGSLATNRPLRHYTPDLHVQATTFRDTWREGRGRVAVAPKFVSIKEVFHCPDLGQYAIKVHFESGAFDDEGRNLIIAASQMRLIGPAEGAEEPPVAYPVGWAQYTKESPRSATYFPFNSPMQYATNVPAQQQADILFVFKTTMSRPLFLQIKNVRFVVPASLKKIGAAEFESLQRDFAPPTGQVAVDPRAPQLDPTDIQVNNELRPLIVSVNQLPSSMNHVDNRLSDGHAVFPQRGDRVGRNLQIEGLLEPAGTKVVQLDVSKRSSATVFGIAARTAGDAATPFLIDQNGGSYVPFGFIYVRNDDNTEIYLDPKNGIRTLDQLMTLLRGGDGTVRLLFYVTEGATIVSFRLNDITVGNCKVEAVARR